MTTKWEREDAEKKAERNAAAAERRADKKAEELAEDRAEVRAAKKAEREMLAEDQPDFVGPKKPPVKQVVASAKLRMVRIDPKLVTFSAKLNDDALLPFIMPNQLQVPRQFFPINDDFNLDWINSVLPDNATDEGREQQRLWRELLEMDLVISR